MSSFPSPENKDSSSLEEQGRESMVGGVAAPVFDPG